MQCEQKFGKSLYQVLVKIRMLTVLFLCCQRHDIKLIQNFYSEQEIKFSANFLMIKKVMYDF